MRASTITGRRILAVSCLVPVAAFLVAACGSAGTGAAPTKTITVTTTPSSPAPAAPASSGTSQCTTADLRLTVGASNGAAGTIYYPLDFTNASSSACTMYGYPGVAFVSSPGGSQVGAAAGRSSTTPALVTLEPAATAHATLAVSDVLIGNNCVGHQVQVSWVQVYPPDQYSALFAPLSRQGCADQSLVTMHVNTVS
ncbi:MAG TPA: DUF4232 domain-containing protein, partial [Streptosporangiaceae bacterium]|nr:DUF4232 domain-containing protein [Streptosporangiaceae bacterium]